MILLDILFNPPDIGLCTAIAPIVAAAIIAGTASVASGIAGAVSNRNSVRDTNASNRQLAEQANAFNEAMMDKQNAWNREQWNLENEYNHPVNQVARIEAAGLNPIWALNGDPGNAQHITGANPAQAVVPTMQAPQYDFDFIPRIAESVVNSLYNSGELGIRGFEAETHRRAQESDSERNAASAEEARANAARLRLQTKWDEESFQVRLDTAAQTLENLEKEYDKMDADTEVAKAKKEEIEANKDLIRERITEVQASIKQRDRELDIMAMNAATNRQSLKVEQSRLELEGRKFEAQCKKWDNDTILSYMDRFAHRVQGSLKIDARGKSTTKVGIPGTNQTFEFQGGVTGSVGYETKLPSDLQGLMDIGVKLTSASNVLIERAKSNPTPSNLNAASKGYGVVQTVDSAIGSYFNMNLDKDDSLDGVLNDVEAPGSFGSRSWLQ